MCMYSYCKSMPGTYTTLLNREYIMAQIMYFSLTISTSAKSEHVYVCVLLNNNVYR